jgi:hypothetical protein
MPTPPAGGPGRGNGRDFCSIEYSCGTESLSSAGAGKTRPGNGLPRARFCLLRNDFVLWIKRKIFIVANPQNSDILCIQSRGQPRLLNWEDALPSQYAVFCLRISLGSIREAAHTAPPADLPREAVRTSTLLEDSSEIASHPITIRTENSALSHYPATTDHIVTGGFS